MKKTRKAILQTICFFDLFDLPLSAPAIHQYLYRQKAKLSEVEKALNGLVEEKVLEQKDKFFTLNGRGEKLILEYVKNYPIKQQLWHRVKFLSALMQFMPYVRGVCVGNSLAFGNVNKNSDIDLFIMVEEKRMWLARSIITFWLHLFGLRRHKDKIRGRFCLSFFATMEALNLKDITVREDDIYSCYWIRTLKPVIFINGYKKVQKANQWVEKYLPNFNMARNEALFPENKLAALEKNFIEALLNVTHLAEISEKVLGHFLKNRAERKAQTLKVKAPAVIISDQMLKFHDQDKRSEIYREWEKKCKMKIAKCKIN